MYFGVFLKILNVTENVCHQQYYARSANTRLYSCSVVTDLGTFYSFVFD